MASNMQQSRSRNIEHYEHRNEYGEALTRLRSLLPANFGGRALSASGGQPYHQQDKRRENDGESHVQRMITGKPHEGNEHSRHSQTLPSAPAT
jgi:hypothetical protein